MAETKEKIHLNALQTRILQMIPRKDQETAIWRPASPAALLFGCKCNIIENGGGAGGVTVMERTDGKSNYLIPVDKVTGCEMHKPMVDKK